MSDDAGHANGFGGDARASRGLVPAGGNGRRAGGPAAGRHVIDAGAPVSVESPRDVPAAPGASDIRNIVECLLLARGGILRIGEIKKVVEVTEPEIRATLAALTVEYGGRGLQIQEVAGGYQLCTRPEYGAYVQRLLRLDELDPLTRATLEVLAVVAYRQPVTRAEIDVIRGVQSVHHLIKLQDRRLIREVGRRPGPGRPILYGTTEGFLRYFGLRDLAALPAAGNRDGTPTLPSAAP